VLYGLNLRAGISANSPLLRSALSPSVTTSASFSFAQSATTSSQEQLRARPRCSSIAVASQSAPIRSRSQQPIAGAFCAGTSVLSHRRRLPLNKSTRHAVPFWRSGSRVRRSRYRKRRATCLRMPRTLCSLAASALKSQCRKSVASVMIGGKPYNQSLQLTCQKRHALCKSQEQRARRFRHAAELRC
jgi:hypothetical protein